MGIERVRHDYHLASTDDEHIRQLAWREERRGWRKTSTTQSSSSCSVIQTVENRAQAAVQALKGGLIAFEGLG